MDDGRRWLTICALWGLLMGSPIDPYAQTSFSDLLKARSEPSAEMWKTLIQAAEFSETERHLLDDRSVMDARGETRLGERSELSGDALRRWTTRSEFSASELRLLGKRSEPDAAQSARIQRYSTPDGKLMRRDWLMDPAMLAAVLRRSEMSPEDQRRIFRSVAWASFQNKIRRSSIDPDDRLSMKRSVPDPTWMRLLRARSVD